MDYVSFVEISSTRSSLVQIDFVSKKIQQHRLLYSLRILSFDESKVSARFIRNLFLTFSSLKFSSDASFFIPLRSVQLHNSKWSRVKVYGKTFGQKSGKFVRSTINSIPARSKSLMSFDFQIAIASVRMKIGTKQSERTRARASRHVGKHEVRSPMGIKVKRKTLCRGKNKEKQVRMQSVGRIIGPPIKSFCRPETRIYL